MFATTVAKAQDFDIKVVAMDSDAVGCFAGTVRSWATTQLSLLHSTDREMQSRTSSQEIVFISLNSGDSSDGVLRLLQHSAAYLSTTH